MRRGWRPILVGAAIAAAMFVLAEAQVFAPAGSAKVAGGDPYRGEAVFERECVGCHGLGGVEATPGLRLVGTGLLAADVASESGTRAA
jgi:mono/diheme cytochrome c family protein